MREQAKRVGDDEFGHAIAALEHARETAHRPPDSRTTAHVIKIAANLRRSGIDNQSVLLVGVAEAIEDWLVNRN